MVKRCCNARTCATCEYWGGAREVDRAPNWVQIPDASEKGMCRGAGPWRGREMSNSATCRNYEKWRYM